MGYNAGNYDVIVVGAGHAGCEAALAAARMGASTLMFSISLDMVANMPCNPSIGGTAKGHLVREIDALGGEMGRNTDKTFIQSKILNATKGPAVYSLRAQADRRRYAGEMKKTLEQTPGLHLRQGEVAELLHEDGRITGVKTQTGAVYTARAVVLTTGTYLRGRIVIGDVSYAGGPDGMFPATWLSDSLKSLGIRLFRFKTGTPARVLRTSIDFDGLEIHPGDTPVTPFSFENETLERQQIPCHLTWTTEETHQVIRDNLHRSPLYSGDIEGVGPRYCPSIEDKVVRFADKPRHPIFIEPMGEDTEEMYLQGMSSSLPEDVQIAMIRTLPGMKHAHVMRSAYAIEYDCIDATQLKLTLEFRDIGGLFSAGQLNGSSGYEEAAAQGLVAGINAACLVLGKEPLILDRSEAYTGVLIDDLVTKGTNEPYRIMTSRAEYRLLLRQDNADQRLTPKGYQVGLISQARFEKFSSRWARIHAEVARLTKAVLPPTDEANAWLERMGSSKLTTGIKLAELLRRPELDLLKMKEIDPDQPELVRSEREQVEIIIKYEGYIQRQLQQVEGFRKMEGKKLPQNVDYGVISGMRLEARQKLNKLKPASVGQASRIAGISPADISVLLVWLEVYEKQNGRVQHHE